MKRAAIVFVIMMLGATACALVSSRVDPHPVVYFIIGGLTSMIASVFSETFTEDEQQPGPHVDINVLSKLQ